MCVAWALCAPNPVQADRKTYEARRIRQLLERGGFVIDPAPEGKRIAWVRIVRDAVFVNDELWPVWPNIFHHTTTDRTVRRELLFKPGDRYNQLLVEESERIVRSLDAITLARIAAVQTPKPNEVGIVLQTRDLWSLRLETGNFAINRQVQTGTVNLVERNLFGRNQALGASYTLGNGAHVVTQNFSARRIADSDFSFGQNAGLYIRRRSPEVEGVFAGVVLSKPLFRLSDTFSYSVRANYSNRISRRFIAGQRRTWIPLADQNGTPFTEETAPACVLNNNCAYQVYRTRVASTSIGGTLRRGFKYKQSLGASFSLSVVNIRPVAETFDIEGGDPRESLAAMGIQLEQLFREQVLPVARNQIGPTLSYSLWTPKFVYYENLSTYGQTEAVRLGPNVSLSVFAPLEEFGSSTDSWVVSAGYSYTIGNGKYYWTGGFGGAMRYEFEKALDQVATLSSSFATRFYGPVRFSAGFSLRAERNDTGNGITTVGLRGYPQGSVGRLQGASRWSGNASMLTKPIEWEAIHLGAVLFYDVGSTYQNLSDMFAKGVVDEDGVRLKGVFHSVGVEIRFLFPQFSRSTFRVPYGVPVSPVVEPGMATFAG